jgi:exosortase D (VPLPA-CTERM-specific)
MFHHPTLGSNMALSNEGRLMHPSADQIEHPAAFSPAYLPVALLMCLLFAFALPIQWLFSFWLNSQDYSHGIFIPIIIGYICWQKRADMAGMIRGTHWSGVLFVLLSVLLFSVALLADIEVVKNYALIVALAGFLVVVGGYRMLKQNLFLLLLLLSVIPVPYLLQATLTAQLQLMSSQIGVAIIRLWDIPVLLEGNVIDLGSYKLLVEEACSGLRYLFPLFSMGMIIAYFFRGPMWQRILLVISTIPITVAMNSFRIGATGILVNSMGIGVAEGFLHDFEGWIVFMAAFVLFLLLVLLLGRMNTPGASLVDLLQLEHAGAGDERGQQAARADNAGGAGRAPLLASMGIFLAAGIWALAARDTLASIPDRSDFMDFPLAFEQWRGHPQYLDEQTRTVLKADDYFLGNYSPAESQPVGLYMVYYGQQKDGSALHSPRVCLPGGGWIIESESVRELQLGSFYGKVNRTLIRQGNNKLLVYYWIQQQGKIFASEYVARASLLLSAIRDRRTDGALIRLTTRVDGDDLAAADRRLQQFLQDAAPRMERHLPL